MGVQFELIKKAQENGSFGYGKRNIWIDVGMTSALNTNLFYLDAKKSEEAPLSTESIIAIASVGGIFVLICLLSAFMVYYNKSQKTKKIEK